MRVDKHFPPSGPDPHQQINPRENLSDALRNFQDFRQELRDLIVRVEIGYHYEGGGPHPIIVKDYGSGFSDLKAAKTMLQHRLNLDGNKGYYLTPEERNQIKDLLAALNQNPPDARNLSMAIDNFMK